MNKIYFYLPIVLCLGCIPQKQLELIHDSGKDKEIFKTSEYKELVIKPNDELLIKVSSFDDISFNYFITQSQGSSNAVTSEMSMTSISYTVNNSGFIFFPILGEVYLMGLNLKQASEKLKKLLSPYFDQPNVIIKYAYQKITILGEVNSPGYHTYLKEKLNIYEALGLAGDVTIHANLKATFLIRTEDHVTTKYKIDLTQNDIFAGDYFQVYPNDVIYIQPKSSKKWRDMSTPVSLLLSTITTTILVLNFIK